MVRVSGGRYPMVPFVRLAVGRPRSAPGRRQNVRLPTPRSVHPYPPRSALRTSVGDHVTDRLLNNPLGPALGAFVRWLSWGGFVDGHGEQV